MRQICETLGFNRSSLFYVPKKDPCEVQLMTQPLTLRPFQQALQEDVPENHHSDQGVQYLSDAYISTLTDFGIEISLVHRGRPMENGYTERFT